MKNTAAKMNFLLLKALREYLINENVPELDFIGVWLPISDYNEFKKLIEEFYEEKLSS